MEQRQIDLGKAVEKFGGFSGLSRKLSEFCGSTIPLSTCHGWHRRNKIPPWRAGQIAALAANEKVDVFKTKRRRKAKPKAS